MHGLAKSLRGFVVAGILAALVAAGAQAALVKVGPLILRADGGFSPTTLPKKKFVPIDFHGWATIAKADGGVPPALEHAVVDFDRDGRLNTSGLAECQPQQVANATPEQARKLCAASIVGEGHVSGLVNLDQGPAPASSLLTIFNGPRLEGNPTVVLHAQLTFPALQTFAIVVPIERRPGTYGYRATLDIPPIAAGLGSLTHIDVKVGRRYVSGGVERSYTSARCADGVLQTHGRFSFADGTVIAGSVFKFCRAR